MSRHRGRPVWRWFLAWIAWGLMAHAQPSSPPGTVDREVSRELFDGLTEATVEGWIHFDALATYSRFFDVGNDRNSVAVTHYERTPNLLFEAWAGEAGHAAIHVLGLLRTNEWCHIAAVLGPRGQRLYFNGLLLATNDAPVGFAQLKPGGHARLGRSVWVHPTPPNQPLHGSLAEVRLWSRERTAEEIQADLYRSYDTVQGRPEAPPGLVRVWGEQELRRPDETDLDRELPEPEQLAHPGILEATVLDEAGRPVNLAQVRILAQRRLLVAGRTGTAGYWAFPDIAGAGRFTAAIHETRSQLLVNVFTPEGWISVPQPSVAAGERRHLVLRLPRAGAGPESTNRYVRELVRDLHAPEPWLREMAALDLGDLGDFPSAAAALASTFALDPDETVRTQLSFTLNKLSYRSPIAIAALLETPGSAEWLRPEAIQESLRQRPVPAVLQTVYTRRTQAVALLFAGILGTFSALHLFVFLFDRRNRTDGLYALFTGVGALGTLLSDLGRVDPSIGYRWLGPACLALSLTLALRLLYALFAPRVPRQFWILNTLFLLGGTRLLLLDDSARGTRPWERPVLQSLIVLVAFLVLAEMLRVVWRAYQERQSGSRLVGGGLVVFALGQLLAPFSAPILLNDVWAAWLFPLSMTIFVASASLYLAREFVRTNRALREANAAIRANQERLTAEIAEAASYVRSLLPTPWAGPGIATAWAFQPSTQLGGDAFGHHALDADRTAFYLLDACGHGVGAALLSVSALNVLRSQALADTDFTNPADVLHELNRRFPMEAHGGQYFTAWYGVYDRRDRTLTYSSAGHPPAYLLAGSAGPQPLRTRGTPVGCLPQARYTNARAQVPPAAELLIISDGVFELCRPDGTPFTLADFERELARHRWSEPSRILDWARAQQGREALEDDFSVLVARIP